ncbi:MAG TPA: hypothetical protein VKM54_09715 [Myxococcota bacterium]|nr:hypothetical protein [Myxococcota bacterium]
MIKSRVTLLSFAVLLLVASLAYAIWDIRLGYAAASVLGAPRPDLWSIRALLLPALALLFLISVVFFPPRRFVPTDDAARKLRRIGAWFFVSYFVLWVLLAFLVPAVTGYDPFTNVVVGRSFLLAVGAFSLYWFWRTRHWPERPR